MSKTCFITAGFRRFSAQEYDKEINFCTSVSPAMLFSTTEKRLMNKWVIIGFVSAASFLMYALQNTTIAFAMKTY